MGRKKRSAQQMIIQSLYGIGHIFTPAVLVAEFLRRNFPFTGRFYYNIQEQKYIVPEDEQDVKNQDTNGDPDYPGFDIVTSDDSVYVAVGIGPHRVSLVYYLDDGDLLQADPDMIIDDYHVFWKSNEYYKRQKQVTASSDYYQRMPRHIFEKIRSYTLRALKLRE